MAKGKKAAPKKAVPKETAPKKVAPREIAPKEVAPKKPAKLTASEVYNSLSKRIEALENRFSQIEKRLPLKTTKEFQFSQLEFDNLVYQIYVDIRERPRQPAPLARLWQEINRKEDISWEDFSRMILRSQDSRFHLVEGKADKVVEDKQTKRYYSNLIGI